MLSRFIELCHIRRHRWLGDPNLRLLRRYVAHRRAEGNINEATPTCLGYHLNISMYDELRCTIGLLLFSTSRFISLHLHNFASFPYEIVGSA